MAEDLQENQNSSGKLELWFLNRGLFSGHFLQARLPQWEEWQVGEELSTFRQGLLSLYEQKKIKLPTLNEAQTEDELIKPVLDLLGYANSYMVQPHAKTGKQAIRPDYFLFPDEASKNEAYLKLKKKEKYYTKCIGIADAKYWERDLDLSKSNWRDIFSNLNPSFQIINYLIGAQQDWGILTNGRLWRLYSLKSHDHLGDYYQVDMVQLLEAPEEKLKYFYLFFRKAALLYQPDIKSFLDRVLEGSNAYAIELEADIKERAYEVVDLLCRGFATGFPPEQLTPQVLSDIYDGSLILLYRLLFVFYAEARELLPLTTNADYRNMYSLRRLTDDIAEKDKKGYEPSDKLTDCYHYLHDLFQLIDSGDHSKGIPEYNGGLFEPQEHQFLEKQTIADAFLVRAIRHLTWVTDKKLGRVVAVDYNTLTERHLGSIYEGLLEFKPRIAPHDLVIIKDKNTIKYAPAKDYPVKEVKYHKGDLYLANDKGERKATGSYYTPEYIVNYIVENTLNPLVNEAESKVKTLKPEVNKEIAKWQKQKEQNQGLEPVEKYDLAITKERERLLEPYLSLKVLDPAMGSGHFLARATDFLAEAIATDPSIELPKETTEETELTYYRRRVVESCIYGVDLNPLAVELAKLTLWLSTMAKTKPLSFLNHHLKVGNSLIGAKVADLDEIPKAKGKKAKSIDLSRAPKQIGQFEWIFNNKIALLLESRALIAQIPTETLHDIHNKEKWELDFEHNAERFRLLADIWISTNFGNTISWDTYNKLLDNIQVNSSEWENLIQNKRIEKAGLIRLEKHFFHWELEFPEVFYEKGGKRKANPGFDAVIGNPPYVLEARENAELFRELKLCPYLAKYYQKNIDLFCFFSCISVDLLAKNGIHSYIVPIYWKDRTGADKMRRKFFEEGRLELLVDFDGFPVFVDAPGHHSSIYVFTKSAEKALPQGYLEIEVDSTLNRESQEKTIAHQLKTRNPQPVSFRLSGGKLIINLLGQKDLIEVFESLPHFHLEEKRVVRGVDTSPSDYQGKGVFVLSDTEFNNISHMLDLKEKEFFKPFYSASQVDAYYFEPQSNQWLLYTDRNRRQKLENYPADYPHLISHLEQFAKIITSDNKPYGLHRAKEEQNFLNESKILFVRKTAYPKFAYCELPFFCDESIYIILPNKDTSQFYLLTIFNSPIFSWWCAHHKTQGSQLQIDKEIVLGMPIRRISFNTPQKERTHLLEEAKGLYKEYLENQDWSKVITFVVGRLPHKADDTPDMEHEQSDVAHDLLAFLAEEMTRLHKEKQSKINGFLTWLEKEILKGSVENQKNKTKIHDFHKGPFEELLDILKKNKTISDPYPPDKRDMLAHVFSDALNAITPLKTDIQATDDLIDQIVYKLYGLTDDEIAIVEGQQSHSE